MTFFQVVLTILAYRTLEIIIIDMVKKFPIKK